ncbi:DEAD/DEAH box helicase [Paenibacillus sonchi]|uniref:DEAD/DEAH box helicase n=1 Tax=Paenibacillus sonchi TaxID=373687 RepID=A0A974PC25_9BACL|nr:ATP-binding domain-containing protein [Paenibacillus sonchi]QQZ61247.1 DEAD/DEAH box helicase [Paenibacillus sonchi]
MENSYFFKQLSNNWEDKKWFNAIKGYANDNCIQTYVVDRPLGVSKFDYAYDRAVVLLIPGHKIVFLNFGDPTSDELDDYIEDFIEELTYRSLRFEYNSILGATRKWRRNYTEIKNLSEIDLDNIGEFLRGVKFEETEGQRKSDLIISLIINSINSIEQVGLETPENLLDKVRQKIVLFDGDQTRFIFEKVNKNRITIQGLAGTGKTELLLHKLKELYTNGEENKIAFTCHSKTLNSSLKNRIPKFFDFMKVEEQIEWNKRLWVFPSWGSEANKTTGLYSYICNTYSIPFYRFSRNGSSFKNVCRQAVKDLKALGSIPPCFNYILIDESQDFPDEFFELCELVVENAVFIAGDIFQNITDNDLKEVHPDYLLNRCYRTDPKTLMFAHAVGMGLFERPAIRWLNDEEWEACGYKFESKTVGNNEEYNLTREPVRRFEDAEVYEVAATKIVKIANMDFRSDVMNIIKEIKTNHNTVKPDDIAIVFLNQEDVNYTYIDSLAVRISNEFGWATNIAYQQKEIVKDHVFVSNRYNIKGLEFPFLICIANMSMTKSTTFRNTLYMTLTRSFITSYLVVNEHNSPEIINIETGLDAILKTNTLKVFKPKANEIMTSEEPIILQDRKYKSQNEIITEIFDDLKIPQGKRDSLKQIVGVVLHDSNDEERIRKIIESNKGLL